MSLRRYIYLRERQVESVEFAKVQSSVFEQLKKGSQVLKAMQAEMSVEAVEELMDDTQEALEYQKEVDSLLSRNLSPEDEKDVLDELESLSTELAEGDLSKPVRQPARLVAKEPVAAAAPGTAPRATRPTSEDQETGEEGGISAADLKELEELEGIMQIPSAPTHAVAVSAEAESPVTERRSKRQLVTE